MSYSVTVIDEGDQNCTYWLSVAVQLARSHRFDDPEQSGDLPQTEVIARKKVWQCCLIRDRMMALATRRPVHITPAQYDYRARLISMEDFEDEISHSKVHDPEARRALAKVFIAECDWSVISTDVLMTIHPEHRKLVCKDLSVEKYSECVCTYKRHKDVLLSWYMKNSSEFPASPNKQCHSENAYTIYMNMLYIYYQ